MADSSYEKGLSELSKMKVADLKVELKQRGLPTTGNKTELVERLQLAIHGDSALSLDETTDEILDEDAVLGDEEIEELASKPDSQDIGGKKRKLSTDSNPSQAKKIILNRNSIIEEIKADQQKDEETASAADDAQGEKKVIKLSQLGVKERLEMRAKKFGVSLSESAKKEVRSARFNSLTQSNGKSASSVKTPVQTSYEVLKKRAERFGTTASEVLEKAELQERIEKRKARFGEVQPLPINKTFPKYNSNTNRVKYVK